MKGIFLPVANNVITGDSGLEGKYWLISVKASGQVGSLYSQTDLFKLPT